MIGRLRKHQLMVAVRTETPEQAYKAAAACIEGGIRFIEITFSVPDAEEVIRKLSADPRVEVGAGTVLKYRGRKKGPSGGRHVHSEPEFR